MTFPDIRFDATVGYGSLATALITLGGYLVMFVRWKTTNDIHVEKITDIEKKVAILDTQLEEHRAHTTENYVKKGDLDKLESRIERMFTSLNDNLTGQIKDVEHHMRNLDSKIYAIATGAVGPRRERDRDRD